MRLGDMRKRGNLYSKLLLTITACISLTLLLTTLMYYTYYTQVEKTEAFRSDLNNLSQTSQDVIRLTESAQSLSFQLYRNYTISKLLLYSNPDIYEVTAAMNELRNYLSSIPYIDSIYVYNPGSPRIYIATSTTSLISQNGVIHKDELIDKGILDLLSGSSRVKPFTPIPRSFSTGEGDKTAAVYSFLCFDTINWNERTNSAIVVNISAEWIYREVASSGSDSTIYLIDDQHRLLSGDSLIELPMSTAEKAWLKENILGKESGYFVQTFRKKNVLISYTAPDHLGWQYLRITPYPEITKQTSKIRNTTLTIAAIILFGGALVSSYLSKHLYKPISRIMLEVNHLASEKRDNMYTLKQNALRHLVLGSNPSKQLDSLQALGIHLHLEEGYYIILLRIDRYKNLLETQGAYIHPYKFAIMNIAAEVCGANYRLESVDMNDDSILLLLNLTEWDDSSAAAGEERLDNLLHQIRTACLEYLKISITSVYGTLQQDADSLNRQYLTVKDASQYRLFRGHGSVISASEIAASLKPIEDYAYAAEWEKKLVEALISGKAEAAAHYLSHILNGTSQFTYDAVQFAYSRVKLAVQSVIDNIRKRGVLPLEGLTDIPALDEVETISELQTAFLQLFEEICSQFAEKKHARQHELVRRINEKIQQDFADPNLNLNQIADQLGMSAVYISRLYKQHALLSIMDVVMETRLGEVCRLLKATDLSIASIAEQTGFASTSYLHRSFKRKYNVTPNEYRHSMR